MATVVGQTIGGLVASLAAAALCAGVLIGGCSDDTTGGGVGPGGTGTGAGAGTGGTSAGGTSAGGTSAGGQGGTPLPPLECGGGFAWDVDVSEDFSLDDTAANQQLPWNKRGAMGASACGDLGLVYRDSDGGVTYAHVTAAGLQGQATVLSASSGQAPVIFYDASCAPQVVTIDSSGDLIQASPSGQDSWEANPIALTPLSGHTASNIVGLVLGRDGKQHLFLHGSDGSAQRLLQGTLEGASWTFRSLPLVEISGTSTFWTSPQVFNYAVDSQGEAHAAFSTGIDLGYAVTSAGAWQQEIVETAVDDRDIPGFEAYIAIGPDDQPAIANGHSTHYVGWSIKTLELYLYTREGGTWTSELIADEADGYVGSDGNRYTGAQIQLFFDAWDQPYVTFNDLASWHITYNYTAVGQIRYAIKACGQWQVATIFQQDGQTASPNPIHECLIPTMATGSDHQTMLFACAERSIPDEQASNNGWSSSWSSYPVTVRALLATQQME